MPSTTFKQTAKGTGSYAPYYIWSLAANWTNGVPGGGYDVSATAASFDTQADDIASLSLNSLSVAATASFSEEILVTGSLTLGVLSLTGGPGVTGAFLIADSAITGAPATITVNSAIFSTGTGVLEALGANASVFVNTADPGNMRYYAGSLSGLNGGLLYLQGAPAASSIFNFNGSGGVFAFANPGASIAASLTNVQGNVSVELPANQIFTVTYGANSVAIATNAGVYNFTNVAYLVSAPNDFVATPDFTTGLEKITFLSAPVFETNATAASGPYNGDSLWSNAANWSTGAVPTAGADVALSSSTTSPTIDDVPNTTVNKLIFSSSGDTLTVNGALTIGALQFTGGGHDTLLASTQFSGGATTATITVNSMIGVAGGDVFEADAIEAIGAGASVVVNGVDPGAIYKGLNGGKLILNVVPLAFGTAVIAESGGTVAFTLPGTAVNGATVLNIAMGVSSGSSIELHGSMLISSMSNDGSNPETITTDDGTYVFDGWYNSSGGNNHFGITDFIATRDISLFMLKLTAEAAGAADNPQHNNDVNGDGMADIVFQNVSGQTAVWEMNGAAIVNPSFLLNPGGTWALIGTGDFTGDGKSDFLFQDASGAIAEWLMNGNKVASGLLPPNPGPTWKIDTTGDFNRDGMSDIALQNNDGSVAIWEMNGANIIANGAAVVANPGTPWKPITSGDFWGDGKSELVLQNTNGSLAFWGFNDSGSGPVLDMTHTAALSLNPGAAWVLKGTGDFNDDAMSDLVFQNSSTGQAAIWEMNQTGLLNATSFTTLPGPGAGWVITQVGDFNNDGMSDILIQNTGTGALGVYLMNGLSLAGTVGLAANPGTAWHVIA